MAAAICCNTWIKIKHKLYYWSLCVVLKVVAGGWFATMAPKKRRASPLKDSDDEVIHVTPEKKSFSAPVLWLGQRHSALI